jgi:hypothetical protein
MLDQNYLSYNTPRMKIKPLPLFWVLLACFTTASAQHRVELTPFAGYQFGGRINYYEGTFRIQDHAVYGGSLGVEVHDGFLAKFTYSYMGTEGDFTPVSYSYNPYELSMSVQYFLLGMEREFGDKLKGFGDFSLGAAWFDSHDDNVSDMVAFSVSLGGGAKIMFTKSIGIKLQGHLLLPMEFAGVSAFAGIGTGGTTGGLTVNSYSVIAEGELSGGLIFNLGGK